MGLTGSMKQKLTDDALNLAELNLLRYSGLDIDKEVEIRLVPVLGGEHYVNTIIIGAPSKPILVLTHGYNGSVTLFYKSLKSLASNFHVFLFDIIGMGTSSRPPFTSTTNIQADEFFIQVFEEWRIALGLTDFFLAAHSFGGYLMGTYASLYPMHVKKLLLLSPLGIKERPQGFKAKNMEYPAGYGPPRWAVGLQESIWGKIRPMGVARTIGTEGMVRKGITRYLRKHQPVENEEEHIALQELMFQILMRPGSTESAIFILFDCALHALTPLQRVDRLANPDLPFPISIVYGDKDWMDSRGSRQIVRANKFFASGQSQLHVLPNSGHQFFVNNPEGIADLIFLDLFGHVTHKFQKKIYSIKYTDDNQNEIGLDPEEIEFREELQLLAMTEEESKEDHQLLPAQTQYVKAEQILQHFKEESDLIISEDSENYEDCILQSDSQHQS